MRTTLRFPVVVLSAAIWTWAAPVWAAWSTTEAGGPGSEHTSTLLYDGTVLFAGGGSSSPQAATSIYDPAKGTWRAGASLGTARAQAAAVMLRDGRVLLTGGLTPNSVVGTTEIYDQVAGTWSPGPPMLQVRRLHTATLLDDGRVLVTAGIGSSGWLASAELFDPQTNSWTATGSIAIARYDHSATRLRDGRVLVAAGTNNSIATGALASVEIYDPAAGTWTSGPSLTHRRQRHTATLLNDGRLLVAGGLYYATPTTPSATFPTQCELFNPATNAWTIVGSLATGRAMHSATLLPEGRVLVTGGTSPGGEIATTEAFDPTFLTWTATGSMAGPRTMHSATILPGGRVLVAGGRLSFGSITPAQIYDGSSIASSAPDLPTAKSRHTATMLPSGRVLVVGSGSAAAFDPAGAGTWSPAASPGNSRTSQTAALLTTGRVLVVAGRDDVAGVVGAAQLYDPAANAWITTGSLAAPRWFHAMTMLGDGRVLVTGGADPGGTVLASVEAYDPATGTWSDLAPLPEPRQKHTATLLKDGRVLVAGGTNGPGAIASSVLFDPATGLWTPTVAPLTTGRYGHSATVLGDGSVLVTGGAGSSGQLASAEVFNPVTLRWSSGGSMAAARVNGHTATLLPDGRVLVAGGVGASGPLVTTEFYDPTRTPAFVRWYGGPSLVVARRDHTATLLTTGGLLVTGGFEFADTRSCRLYRTPAPQAAPPTLTLVNDPVVDGQVDVTGTGFTSRSHASMGTSGVDSPSNYPLVQVRRIDNGSVRWLAIDPSTPWTDTAFGSRPTPGLQSGPALVTVFVNGQQALSRVTNVRATNLVPAAVPGGPYGASVGSPVTFDGSGSSDPEGDPLEYAWDFGDGSTGSGAAPVHTYASAGTYTVTLVVSDGFASSAPATTTATVADTVALEVSVGSLENGWGELLLEAPGTPSQQCSGPPFGPLVCSFTYPIGTVVTVTAIPAPDSALETWAGACSGDDPVCLVTVTQGASVGAGFLGPRTLRVTASSLEGGIGYVGVSPPPLSGSNICEVTGGPSVACTFLYRPHTIVDLGVTTAASHTKFLGWTGACTGSGPCSVTLDGGVGAPPVDVDAAFLGPRTLRVLVSSIEGGVGYVGVSPPPLSGPPTCEAFGQLPVECVYTFPPDTPVQVGQTTANSSKFLGWGGECFGNGPCGVVLDGGPGTQPKVVIADFMGPRTLRVLVSSIEGGVGYVAVSPPPLSGPPTCEAFGQLPVECVYTFPPDTPVQVGQTTANTSKFLGWGGECFGNGPCGVVLDGGPGTQPKVVIADFMGPRTLRVLVSSIEGGLGYVAVSPPPLSGPPTCEAIGQLPVECVYTFPPDTPVQVGQTTANTSKFLGWGGECFGNGPCGVVLDGGPGTQPKVVIADFMGPRTLRVLVSSIEGGVGSVAVFPDPLSGPSVCEASGPLPVECVLTYPPDAPVQLFHNFPFGSKFLGWGGDCFGLAGCAVVLDGGPGTPPKLVIASFLGPRTLRVSLSGIEGGAGSVTAVPPPLSGPSVCEVSGSFPVECEYTFPPDTGVQLTAQALPPSVFQGWQQGCSGTGACLLFLNGGSGTPPVLVSGTFEIPNRPPTASPGGPYSAVRNQPIAFDGTGSSDPDGDPLTYTWDFGDGATGTGPTPSHAYAGLGVFTVTLVVSDGVLSSAPAAASVTISNRAPSANAGGPYSGTRTQPVLFSGAGSSDPDGDPLTYAWSFGDGAVGNGVAPSHSYASLGTFAVSLVVNDGTAGSAPATSTVTISNLLPAVGLTSPPAGSVFHAPAVVPLAANASDPDGSVALVEFFAGSVKVAEDATAPYAALWSGAAPGAYLLTARVTDESGASAVSAPVGILVNAPPSVSITAPAPDASFVAPGPVPLEANASDPDGTVAQVEFFANGTPLGIVTTSPYTLTWSNVAAGVYNVTARATDNLGAVTTSASRTVRVTAVLGPTADSYVREGGSANNNFGTSTALEVLMTTSANERWTYLKFDTSAVASVTSARLRLFGNLTSTTSTVVRTQAFGAANTTWTETGITWNNKPPSGSTVLAAVTLVNNSTTARWYEWDLTAYLQQEKAAGRNVVTLVMKNNVNTNPTATFRSRQASSNRPELRVTP